MSISEFQIQLILFPVLFFGGSYLLCRMWKAMGRVLSLFNFLSIVWWFDIHKASGNLILFYYVLKELNVTFVTGSGKLLHKEILY